MFINQIFFLPKPAEGPGKSDDVRKEEQGPYAGISNHWWIEESQQREYEGRKILVFVPSLCMCIFIERRKIDILSSVWLCFSVNYAFYSINPFIYAVIFL